MKFQSSYAPDVSVEAYLERIRKYSRCSDACFVMALIYVDRMIETRGLTLTTLNVHRLLITSVMLAAKFHDDLFYNNTYYSKLGGLSLQELNLLEVELLNQLDFSCFVHENAYCKYSMQLQNYVFYLKVVPAPTQVSAPCPPAYTAMHAQTGAVMPHAPLSLSHPSVTVNSGCHQNGAYYSYDSYDALSCGGGGGVSGAWVGVPSPNNAHAKACTVSDYYVTANSPLRMAPAAQMAAFQHQQQQLHAQAQASFVANQQYVASYNAAELETEIQLQCMSPMVYPSAMEIPFNRSTSGGSAYFQQSCPSSLRDSGDEGSTTCSTRTTSPYPNPNISGLYNRSLGFGGVSTLALHYPGGPTVNQTYTPPKWTGVDNTKRRYGSPQQQQQQQHQLGLERQALSIQTEWDVPFGGHPLYRRESDSSIGSTTTSYPLYEQPRLNHQVSSFPIQQQHQRQHHQQQQLLPQSPHGSEECRVQHYRLCAGGPQAQGVVYPSSQGYEQQRGQITPGSSYRVDASEQLASRYLCTQQMYTGVHVPPRVVTPQLTPPSHQQSQCLAGMSYAATQACVEDCWNYAPNNMHPTGYSGVHGAVRANCI